MGPMHQDISAQVAISRLRTFTEKFSRMEGRRINLAEGGLIVIMHKSLSFLKWSDVSTGEALFGLKLTEYPELAQAKKELQQCDLIYTLYTDVNTTFAQFKDASWRCDHTSIFQGWLFVDSNPVIVHCGCVPQIGVGNVISDDGEGCCI